MKVYVVLEDSYYACEYYSTSVVAVYRQKSAAVTDLKELSTSDEEFEYVYRIEESRFYD